MHIGGEGGNDDPLIAVLKLTIQAFCHHILTGGITAPLHIGGITQQGQHALIAQFAQTSQVCHTAHRGGVDLKVTGHYHRTHRGVDGKGHRIRNGVVYVNEFHSEAAGLHAIAGLVGDELHRICQPMLLQLQLNEAVGHGCAVNGTIYLPHTIGNGSDMVLVAVGHEHTPQLFLIFHQVGEVRDHQIHAIHILLRETNAAIDNDHILAVFQNCTVLTDLIQSSERNDLQFFCQVKSLLLSIFCQKAITITRQPHPTAPAPFRRLRRITPA